ncbi:MAG TPA: DNA primase [Pseudoclavibacter sp.]|nr:DNA primase [Pseudoclavibacter sp.]
MPGRIVRADIDAVRERVNIAEVIGQYVTLKPAGVGSLKGLCPFHEERSPSFNVRPQAGFYHCFGCGEGGDVFTFLQKVDHMSFTDAVELLARRVGVELHYEDGPGNPGENYQHRARLLQANQAASDFFQASLDRPEARPAREMLLGRHFDQNAARHFGVGYAPQGWSGLRDALHAKGFSDDELIAAGLVTQGSRGTYDRFRGRVVWPIRDVTGQTIGFGARKLFDDDNGPKYLNTPETALYRKSQVLYGLDLAKKDIAAKRQVVIVEGYTDVMACHLAGVTTAVATCGTAFGPEHIAVLRRIISDQQGQATDVIFTFDPDNAGKKAALRAFAEERRFVAQTYVAVSPGGLDPCDLRIERGDQAVRALVHAKQPLVEFAMKQTLSGFDMNTVAGRAAALHATAPMVAEVKDPAARPGYVRLLAGWLGVDVAEVEAEVRRRATGQSRSTRRSEPEAAPRRETQPAAPAAVTLPGDVVTRQERQLIEVLLQCPEAVDAGLRSRAESIALTNETLATILAAIVAAGVQPSATRRVEAVVEHLSAEYAPVVRALAAEPLPVRREQDIPAYADGVVRGSIEVELTRRKAAALRRLGMLDPQRDEAEREALSRTLMAIDEDRLRLRQE